MRPAAFFTTDFAVIFFTAMDFFAGATTFFATGAFFTAFSIFLAGATFFADGVDFLAGVVFCGAGDAFFAAPGLIATVLAVPAVFFAGCTSLLGEVFGGAEALPSAFAETLFTGLFSEAVFRNAFPGTPFSGAFAGTGSGTSWTETGRTSAGTRCGEIATASTCAGIFSPEEPDFFEGRDGLLAAFFPSPCAGFSWLSGRVVDS